MALRRLESQQRLAVLGLGVKPRLVRSEPRKGRLWATEWKEPGKTPLTGLTTNSFRGDVKQRKNSDILEDFGHTTLPNRTRYLAKTLKRYWLESLRHAFRKRLKRNKNRGTVGIAFIRGLWHHRCGYGSVSQEQGFGAIVRAARSTLSRS